MSSSNEEFKAKLKTLTFGKVPGGNRQEKGVRKGPNPAWERGIKTERRVDGSEMPYLNANGDPIRMKEYSERRHVIDEAREALRKPTVE